MSKARHNGNQVTILGAVRRGRRTVKSICRATGLAPNAVRTALLRLQDKSLVRREGYTYHDVPAVCPLERAWRRVPLGDGVMG